MDTQHTTTNTAAADSTQRDETRPQRARGSRGAFRARFNNEERPFRARGRGGHHGERNNDVQESSDNLYNDRPQFRGRGASRGQESRARGRWTNARPLREQELANDEDVYEVTLEQSKFIEKWRQQGRESYKGIKDDFIIRACIEHDFNDGAVQRYLEQYKTDEKYKGLKDFEWSEVQTRQDVKAQRQRQAQNRERQRQQRENEEKRAQKRAEMEQIRAEQLAAKQKQMEERKAQFEERKARKAERIAQLAAEAQNSSEQKVEDRLVESPTAVIEENSMPAAIAAEVINNDNANEETNRPKQRKPRTRSNPKNQKAVYKPKVAAEVQEEKQVVTENVQSQQVESSKPDATPQTPEQSHADQTKKNDKKQKKPKAEAPKAEPVQEPVAETKPQMTMPPQMMQMPMMGMMQMPEGMTLEQQNLFNQQLIMQQQMMLNQYHQQLMMMMVQQNNNFNGGQGMAQPPMMPMMFGFPGQQPPANQNK